MNYLANSRLYLSGPIEYQKDMSWRDPVIKHLRSKFNINVFDPHSDPKQQWFQPLVDAKSNKDWETVRSIAKSFVRKDLCMVDRSDFLIAYLPKGVPTVGTHHEVINAVNAKKPVLLVTDGGDISNISSWYFGFIPFWVMFPSFETMYSYLEEVDNGLHKENNRWSFIYGIV